jgi:hypothetical protein
VNSTATVVIAYEAARVPWLTAENTPKVVSTMKGVM